MMKAHLQAPLVLLAATLLSFSSASAQAPRTITVMGAGTSTALPSHVVMKGRIEAGGDSAADAWETFQKLRGEAEKLTEDDSKRLKVRFLGERLTRGGSEELAAIALSPSGEVAATSTIVIAEEIELRIDFAGEMERAQAAESLAAVFDKAQAAGVKFGPASSNAIVRAMMMGGGGETSLVEFRAQDPDALEGEAYAAAIADARRKAEKLAALTGSKVGAVVAVEEIAAGKSDDNPYAAMILAMQAGTGESPAKAASPANGEIQVESNLRVSFALEPAGE